MATIPLDFLQSSFSGGMNMSLDSSRINSDEYVYAKNIRNRFDILSPIRGPKNIDISSLIHRIGTFGYAQGLRIFGDYLLLFTNGRCYYINTENPSDTWHQVPDFQMNSRAAIIYTELVPASVMNVQRKLPSADNQNTDVNYNSSVLVSGTPQAFVCQDGISQPWIIYIDSFATVQSRQANTYNEWDNTPTGIREYVPIGRMMKYVGAILYIVSPDQTQIYRSVSGRPLDFMVNIDTNGNKLATEALGGANRVSHAVGYDQITSLQVLNTGDLFVANKGGSCFSVTPDFNSKLFGEPEFDNTFLFNSICVNQRSFVDILGDSAFISINGIRSYNAVLQLHNQGRNSIFSLRISKLFDGLSQTLDDDIAQEVSVVGPCATIFDNYALFSVNTINGYLVVVYDTLNQTFPCVDTFNGFDNIIEFAPKITGTKRIFAITSNNTGPSRLLELFAGDDLIDSYVETRSYCSNDPSKELKSVDLRLVFDTQIVDGIATVVQETDGNISDAGVMQQNILATGGQLGIPYPAIYPLLYNRGGRKSVINTYWNFQYGTSGFKTQYFITWTGGASITHLMSNNKELTPAKSQNLTQP